MEEEEDNGLGEDCWNAGCGDWVGLSWVGLGRGVA